MSGSEVLAACIFDDSARGILCTDPDQPTEESGAFDLDLRVEPGTRSAAQCEISHSQSADSEVMSSWPSATDSGITSRSMVLASGISLTKSNSTKDAIANGTM